MEQIHMYQYTCNSYKKEGRKTRKLVNERMAGNFPDFMKKKIIVMQKLQRTHVRSTQRDNTHLNTSQSSHQKHKKKNLKSSKRTMTHDTPGNNNIING